uniref:Ras-related protein Rab n=1 Tax=Monopterus albus TaxID=43700 RepID=A0A3Q3R7H1_MONAL
MHYMAICTEKLYKVIVIGDVGVGKSSIISHYINKLFSEEYKTTIGLDFALKKNEWDARTVVRLQLWDIAGQEMCKNISRVFYKGAMGAVVVFDITNSSTLEAASDRKRDLDSKVCLDSGHPIPAVLLANKCDMTARDEDLVSSLDAFCRDNAFLGWFKTSAKENINIDEAGAFLVKQMMLCDISLSDEERHWDGITLDQAPEESQRLSLCC